MQIHLYGKGEMLKDKTFPEFPSNSYKTNNINTLLETLKDLFNNHNSGISKVLIENDEFGWECDITNCQSLITLDNNKIIK